MLETLLDIEADPNTTLIDSIDTPLLQHEIKNVPCKFLCLNNWSSDDKFFLFLFLFVCFCFLMKTFGGKPSLERWVTRVDLEFYNLSQPLTLHFLFHGTSHCHTSASEEPSTLWHLLHYNGFYHFKQNKSPVGRFSSDIWSQQWENYK